MNRQKRRQTILREREKSGSENTMEWTHKMGRLTVWQSSKSYPWKTVAVQQLNCVQPFETSWTTACQAPLSFVIFWSLLRFMPIESVMLSNHLILGHPLLLLPSIFPQIRVFSNELALPIRWPKYWSFSIRTSSEYSGLISLMIDWFDLLTVQGTLKESCPAPQFKSVSSLVLSSLYGTSLTSVQN